jgi:ribonucleoside-diphosphate reductase alpha chain
MGGGRSIAWRGHLRMMAAAQPFLSGAISKTINMPEESTVEDTMQAYTESWKYGLKAVAIYRDNSKRSQPLSASGGKKKDAADAAEAAAAVAAAAAPQQKELFEHAHRRKLPDERRSITHKFSLGNHDGYITVGMYDDGTPGEIFIKMSKEGATLSGLMDGIALSISIGLQYGVPLKALVDKLMNTRFEPSGFTANPEIRFASSVLDYIARWLGGKFISADYLKLHNEGADVGIFARPGAAPLASSAATPMGDPILAPSTAEMAPMPPRPAESTRLRITTDDAPYCSECGMLMTPNGSCYKCTNCGSTSGCS